MIRIPQMAISWGILLLSLFTVTVVGCSPSENPGASGSPESAQGEIPNSETGSDPTQTDPTDGRLAANSNSNAPGIPTGISLAPKENGNAPDHSAEILEAEQAVATGLQLPPEMSDSALMAFIGSADDALGQLIRTPRTLINSDPLDQEIRRVAKLKQVAAEQLLQSVTQDDEIAFAIRARLQALSHQAATGNVQAANDLESYAFELINHTNKTVQLDSRTTLVALALDRLRTGLAANPDDVLRFAKQLTTRPDLVDVASIKAMEHAVNTLAQYNYPTAAEQLRQELADTILKSPSPAVQEVGAQVIADFRFAALESLRNQISSAQQQSPDAWKQAAETAASKAQDAVTLRYLATLALQLESMELIESSRAINETIEAFFFDVPDEELSQLANQAVNAFEARQNAIGRPFPPHPSQTSSGQPFRLEDHQNEIVLFVFWSTDQPDSMAGLAAVEVFAEQSTEPLRIIGVNCESTERGRGQATRLIDTTLEFPNLTLPIEASGAPTPLESALGIVSYPTVIVVGPRGNVTKVVLGSEQLDAAIASLSL